MPTHVERARDIMALISAAADATRVLVGVDGAAASRLAALAAAEVEHVLRSRAARAARARRQRRRR